jgi:hypothetical protein
MHYNQSFMSSISRDNHSAIAPVEKSNLFASQHNSLARSALRDKTNTQHWEPNRLLDIFAKDFRPQKKAEVTTRLLQRIMNIRGPISQSTVIRQNDSKAFDHKWESPSTKVSVHHSYNSHVIEKDFKEATKNQEAIKLEHLKRTLCEQEDFHLRGLLHFINARQNTRLYQIDELIRLLEPTTMILHNLPDKIITKDEVLETFTPNTSEHLNLIFGRCKTLEDVPMSAKTRNLICEILALKYKQ